MALCTDCTYEQVAEAFLAFCCLHTIWDLILGGRSRSLHQPGDAPREPRSDLRRGGYKSGAIPDVVLVFDKQKVDFSLHIFKPSRLTLLETTSSLEVLSSLHQTQRSVTCITDKSPHTGFRVYYLAACDTDPLFYKNDC